MSPSTLPNHQKPEVVATTSEKPDLTADDWAGRIRGQLARTVEGFVAAGRELLTAKAALAHGEFEPMVTERVGLSLRTAETLMAIARHGWLANPQHVAHLPPSWGTLYELSRLPADELEAAADAGELVPALSRREALMLVRGRSEPDPEPEPDPERVEQRSRWERRVAADTVVRMWATSHRLQEVFRLHELGMTANLTAADLDEAAKRWRAKHPKVRVPRVPPTPGRVARGAPGPAPEGEKWCSFGKHFTSVDDFGINQSRPDGLSNLCRDHWHEYWHQRAAKESARRRAGSR